MQRAFVACLVVAALGCDAVLGIRELPRGEPPVDAYVPPKNPRCITCEEAKCAPALAACKADTNCDSVYDCLLTCEVGDVKCRSKCELQHNALTHPAFQALDLCKRQSCPGECFGASGFGAAINPACACMNEHCASEMLACVRSDVDVDGGAAAPGACERRLACIARQPNPDGYVDCVSDYVGGVEANALLDCMRKNRCETAAVGRCPLDEGELTCASNFVYGRSRAPTVKFSFGVEDFLANPIAARVTACAPASCEPLCESQGGGATDATTGRTTFDLRMSGDSFEGCIRVVPTNPDYMPTNVFTGRRIHRDEAMLNTIALQQGLLKTYTDQAGVTLVQDDAHGHVVVTVHDCLWGRIVGAKLNMLGSDPRTLLAYLSGSKVASVGADGVTTVSGTAAYVNVPVGPHVISVTKDGREVAKLPIVVRPQELTDANIYPLNK